jgi:RNA polymerase sigma-70 factor (ECF subfamily)
MPQQLEGSVIAEESALIKRVARGEGEAVEALVRLYGGAVFRFVYRRIGEQYDEAQDLVQETLLAALSLADRFDGSCSVNTWLCSLAKIKVADHLRRQGRQKRIPASMLVEIDADGAETLGRFQRGDATVEDVLGRLDARAFLDGVTAQVSEDEREALLLHYVDGFSIEEMSRLMNRSAKGVESLLTRAKRRCREVAAGWITG